MKDKLHQLRELLTDPNRWTRGALARDKDGNDSHTAAHETSICYCLVGGVDKVCPDDTMQRVAMRLELRTSIYARYQHLIPSTKIPLTTVIADWNDDPETTHEMVLGLIDYTIDRLAA